jgi:hypothetical protein
MIFLGVITAWVGYVIYEASGHSFLTRVFPLSVALITLALLVAAIALSLRSRPSYVLHDSEREWSAEERPRYTEWHFQGWMLGLLAAIAAVGFVLGIFLFLCAFLRVKANVAWTQAALAGAVASTFLSLLSHLLVFYFPRGLLQVLVEMPWPFN